jgi:hypothetical protein
MHTGCRLGNPKESDYLIYSGIGGRVMLKCVLRNTTRERERERGQDSSSSG